MEREELLKLAFRAMENAYAPYSHYKVGACVLCKDGSYYLGCNIENASFGATNCGERTAVFSAYAAGKRKDDIAMLTIVSNGKRIGTPCGICRQVLSELLNQDTPIILSNGEKTVETNIAELLPWQFGSEDL